MGSNDDWEDDRRDARESRRHLNRLDQMREQNRLTQQNVFNRHDLQTSVERLRNQRELDGKQMDAELAQHYSDIDFNDHVRRENIRLKSLMAELEIQEIYANLEAERIAKQTILEHGHDIELVRVKAEEDRKTLSHKAALGADTSIDALFDRFDALLTHLKARHPELAPEQLEELARAAFLNEDSTSDGA